jgi:DHA1 family multidrug resistance protein-like MFS transporter
MDTLTHELQQAEIDAERQLSRPSLERAETRRSSLIRATTTRGCDTPAMQWQTIISRQEEEGDLERLERHQTVPLAISRVETQKLQYTQTVGGTVASRTRSSREPWPAFGGGKPYPPPLPAREQYVVEFDGANDPTHPQNWSLRRK